MVNVAKSLLVQKRGIRQLSGLLTTKVPVAPTLKGASSLRRFYAGLYDRVFEKNKSNLEKYYKALEAYICTLSTYDKMPSDSTFNEGLHYKNMYKKSRVLRYFFDIIENDNKEPVDMSDLTIEHILPETLSNQSWHEGNYD